MSDYLRGGCFYYTYRLHLYTIKNRRENNKYIELTRLFISIKTEIVIEVYTLKDYIYITNGIDTREVERSTKTEDLINDKLLPFSIYSAPPPSCHFYTDESTS